MICKGCNEERKLIKAHVIPESFFRDLRANEKTLFLVSNVEGAYRKKAPVGVYDEKILCRKCEDLFQKIDDYAAKVLINPDQIEELSHPGEKVGYRIKNVDTEKFKLFVISLLWRASVSQHTFYKNVNLGALENKAKDLLWKNSAGSAHEFSYVLAKFDETGKISKTMLDPHPERWFGRRYYRFYIASYVLYVKSDSQATPEKWERFIPDKNSLILVSRGKLEGSKEFPILVDGVRNNAKT